MKNRYIRYIYIITVCMSFLTCRAEEDEGAGVPPALIGVWGLTFAQDSKYPLPVLEVYAARVAIGGVYFDIRSAGDVDYSRERGYNTNPSRYPYRLTGSLYSKGPGAPGLFSQYRLSRDDILYLDGGEILSGPLPSALSRIK